MNICRLSIFCSILILLVSCANERSVDVTKISDVDAIYEARVALDSSKDEVGYVESNTDWAKATVHRSKDVIGVYVYDRSGKKIYTVSMNSFGDLDID